MREEIERHLPFVDGVAFDFGGVIARASGDESPVYALCERHGLPRAIVMDCNERYRRLTDLGELSMEDLYARAVAEAGIREPYPGFCWDAAAADSEGWIDFAPETFSLMKELKALGKRLGLVSNTSQFFYEEYYCRRAGHIHALMDAEILSWREHITKPDGAIVAIAAERMGLPPQRLLFLDDMPENVEGARRCGWRAEVYTVG